MLTSTGWKVWKDVLRAALLMTVDGRKRAKFGSGFSRNLIITYSSVARRCSFLGGGQLFELWVGTVRSYGNMQMVAQAELVQIERLIKRTQKFRVTE